MTKTEPPNDLHVMADAVMQEWKTGEDKTVPIYIAMRLAQAVLAHTTPDSVVLRNALKRLIDLKAHKDAHGKNNWYVKNQKDAWAQAVAAMGELGSDVLDHREGSTPSSSTNYRSPDSLPDAVFTKDETRAIATALANAAMGDASTRKGAWKPEDCGFNHVPNQCESTVVEPYTTIHHEAKDSSCPSVFSSEILGVDEAKIAELMLASYEAKENLYNNPDEDIRKMIEAIRPYLRTTEPVMSKPPRKGNFKLLSERCPKCGCEMIHNSTGIECGALRCDYHAGGDPYVD